MKTFVLFLIAGLVASKELPTADVDAPTYDDDKPADENAAEGEQVDDAADLEEKEETWEEYWARLDDEMLMAKMGWNGVWQGLYGFAGEDDKPTEDCFGDWIPEKMKEVSAFREVLSENWMAADADQAAIVAYDVIDLLFLNDKHCHFRKALWDVHNFCLYSESCETDKVFENM